MRRLLLPSTVVIALALGLAARAPAVAAQPAPADAKLVSRQHYDEATAAYKLGHFEAALAGYEAAYQAFAAPAFLFNIAQCHLQLGRWDRAIFFFEGYLRELPQATNHALVEELIQEAERKRREADEAERQRREAEALRLERERRAAEERELARRLDTAVAPPPRAEAPVYKKWWFWAAVGGVAAGAATAVVVGTGGTRTVLPAGSLGTWDRR